MISNISTIVSGNLSKIYRLDYLFYGKNTAGFLLTLVAHVGFRASDACAVEQVRGSVVV